MSDDNKSAKKRRNIEMERRNAFYIDMSEQDFKLISEQEPT